MKLHKARPIPPEMEARMRDAIASHFRRLVQRFMNLHKAAPLTSMTMITTEAMAALEVLEPDLARNWLRATIDHRAAQGTPNEDAADQRRQDAFAALTLAAQTMTATPEGRA